MLCLLLLMFVCHDLPSRILLNCYQTACYLYVVEDKDILWKHTRLCHTKCRRLNQGSKQASQVPLWTRLDRWFKHVREGKHKNPFEWTNIAKVIVIKNWYYREWCAVFISNQFDIEDWVTQRRVYVMYPRLWFNQVKWVTYREWLKYKEKSSSWSSTSNWQSLDSELSSYHGILQ